MNKVRCPICGRRMPGQEPTDWPERPFCSSRCRLIDLGRWLGEDYRLPAQDSLTGQDGDDLDPPKPAVPSAVPNREEA